MVQGKFKVNQSTLNRLKAFIFLLSQGQQLKRFNRIVPIHSKIVPLVEHRLDADSEFFINVNGDQVSQTTYRTYWNDLMQFLHIEKTPHECRHTFESILDSKGANRKCIDLMMGHVSKDVGNRVYNHKTLEELKSAIELLKVN